MATPNVGNAVQQTVLEHISDNQKGSISLQLKGAEEPIIPEDVKQDGTAMPTVRIPQSKEPYTVLEEPNRVGKKIKVITIGAGASALNFAHDIDTNPLNIDLVMYEKNPEIGGTWFENRYPGCACDIPSVVYQLSWAPSAEWGS